MAAVIPQVARGPVAVQYAVALHARYAEEHEGAFENSGVRPVAVPDGCTYTRLARAASYSEGDLRDAFGCRALMRVRLLTHAQQAKDELLSAAGSYASSALHRVWFLSWDASPHADDLRTAWRAVDESPGACAVVPMPDTNGPGERGVMVRGAGGPYAVVDAASVEGLDACAPAGTVRVAAAADMDWAFAAHSTFAAVPFAVAQIARSRATVDDGLRVTGVAEIHAYAGEHVGWFHEAQLRGVPVYAVAGAKSARAAATQPRMSASATHPARA